MQELITMLHNTCVAETGVTPGKFIVFVRQIDYIWESSTPFLISNRNRNINHCFRYVSCGIEERISK